MCATCGCDSNGYNITHEHEDHQHDDHGQGRHSETVVSVEKDILYQNNLLAERNRGYFESKNIFALNLVSSPGSGKTSLLEKTLTDLRGELDFFVVEGDQQTSNDADRIHATGTRVIQ